MYQIKLNGRFLFHSPNINLVNQIRSRYFPNAQVAFNRSVVEIGNSVNEFTHTLSFVPITYLSTSTKQTYSPSTQYFNRYHRRGISVDPPLATSSGELPNQHLLEVFNVTKSEYLLDFSQAGFFWNNSSNDNVNSPSVINKLGTNFSSVSGQNQLRTSFYYGLRISSNGLVVCEAGDIIRIRLRKYISGDYGTPIVYGDTIAEIYFLEDSNSSYSDPTYPTIVDSQGNLI